jgi:regulator of sigma E protease
MLQVYVTLGRLFQGSVGVQHLQGPVGIVHTGTRVARQGGTYLLFFLGLISVNLAVINFLPIPIVDGGHMVFLLVEKLKGSPVSDRIQTAALYVGLAMILSIFAMTFYYDIARIVTGG